MKIKIKIVEIEEDGCHLLVKATFNNKKNGYLILDTGASKTVFDIESLTPLVDMIPFDEEKIKSSGISEGFLQSKVGILPHLQIGNLILIDETIVMLDLSHINKLYEQFSKKKIWGLIGGDFYKKFQAEINYKKCVLTVVPDIKANKKNKKKKK
jgi:hypothetical protein